MISVTRAESHKRCYARGKRDENGEREVRLHILRFIYLVNASSAMIAVSVTGYDNNFCLCPYSVQVRAVSKDHLHITYIIVFHAHSAKLMFAVIVTDCEQVAV